MYKKVLLFFVATILVTTILACSDGEQNPESGLEKPVAEFLSAQGGDETQVQPGREEQDRALKIGVIGPETGKEADYGLRILGGVRLAARTFNAHGGIGGRMIEVLHYDNKGDPELTTEAVRRLIQKRVVAILAAPTGWSTFAATHMANDSRTIFVAIGTRRRIGKSGPYVFRSSLPDELAIDELIRVSTKELGYTDYALITASDYDYSLDLSSLFQRAVAKHGGMLRVVADTYDTYSGKRDLDGVIAAIRNSPEPLHAVIYTGNSNEGVQLAQGVKGVGLKLPIIGGEDLFTKTYLDKGGKAVKGTLLYTSFAPDSDSPTVMKFVRDYKKETGHAPDRFVALAYDTFMFVAEAIQMTGSTKSSVVRDAMISKKDYQGVTGETGFTDEGTPIKRPFIYRVEGGKAGERFVLLRR